MSDYCTLEIAVDIVRGCSRAGTRSILEAIIGLAASGEMIPPPIGRFPPGWFRADQFEEDARPLEGGLSPLVMGIAEDATIPREFWTGDMAAALSASDKWRSDQIERRVERLAADLPYNFKAGTSSARYLLCQKAEGIRVHIDAVMHVIARRGDWDEWRKWFANGRPGPERARSWDLMMARFAVELMRRPDLIEGGLKDIVQSLIFVWDILQQEGKVGEAPDAQAFYPHARIIQQAIADAAESDGMTEPEAPTD